MKLFRNLFIIVLFMCLSAVAKADGFLNDFRLLPLPQQMEVKKGEGINPTQIGFIVAKQGAEMPVLGELLNKLPRHEKKGKGVTLLIRDDITPQSPEGYILEINKEGVSILARQQAGLFYACQTLEQLLEDSRDASLSIPPMKITDYPMVAYRAVHFDTKHHLDRVEYYYRTIDKLARYKVNAVIWEIEDKLRFTRRPEIGAPNAISKQEMQAICRYAKERNIEITPLVQGLGHAGFILKHHWELRENPQSDWEFCPSDPRTYEVQFDLYRDAIEAMPYSKYLHIGGDEITAIGIDERCKATGKTAFELQMIWLKKVCDFALSCGRIPVFWDDMPLKYANLWWVLHQKLSDQEILKNWNTDPLDAAIQLFPEQCIYMRWHYDDPTTLAHKLLLDWYRQKGLHVMGATAASMGETPFMPRNHSRVQYIKDFSKLVSDNNLDGILATAWDDGAAHLETVMRGFIAQGEYGWNPKGRTVDEFREAHAWREFGLKFNEFSFLADLERSAFFFDGALVRSGTRNPAWGVSQSFQLISLPDPAKPGEWSELYAGKLDTAHIESARYNVIVDGLEVSKTHALRNRYTLAVYEQTNELFHFPTRLLLALEGYDKAVESSQRAIALNRIRTVCDSFSEMRRNLEQVYSKTRFMHQPEGYIADQNHHHHLAALTQNSDWMYLYEIPFIAKIEEWIEKNDARDIK